MPGEYKNIEINEEVVLIGEGLADENFFKKLIARRPVLTESCGANILNAEGVTKIATTLKGISRAKGFRNVKGVLIAADSGSDPTKTFDDICKQIKSATGYNIPAKPLEIAPKTDDYPAVAVMLLPDENTPGGLEALCVEEIIQKYPWVEDCVETFLSCGEIDITTWPVEKQGKARFHSMVAALNRDDPSRSLSKSFKDPNPIIDVSASCFDKVAEQLKDFCCAVRK
ncbi:MAG: hypothetical protein HQK89_11075 [Nitrospirae bacterium]|nr:hypothetical protein [Nitrospirota bacterium]